MCKMILKDFQPILAVPAIPIDNGIRFLLHAEQIEIKNEMIDIIWDTIRLCDGFHDIEQIADISHNEKDTIIKIIEDLVTLHILYDSRELYMKFHELSNSPDAYFRRLSKNEIIQYTNSSRKPAKIGVIEKFGKDDKSEISKIIFQRRTCRNFSAKKLNKNIIGNICYNAYSVIDHSVPSGGGLYPLKIYILIEKDQTDLQKGYYEFDSEKNVLIRFASEIDEEKLKYCFNDETLPFGSSVQIVIAADLKRETYKYSNRGYRLTLIEAGHVAQNISLYCTENQIGVCELGGVLDEPLIDELNLVNQQIYPLVTIAIGKKAEGDRFDYLELKDRIEAEYVGDGKPIKEYGSHFWGSEVAFFGAYSVYGESDEIAGATSSSFHHAITKAIIEGYERYRSGLARVDFQGCAESVLKKWLSPNEIRTLTDKQIKKNKLVPFSEHLSINWTCGEYLSGREKVLVPTDLVYYGKNYIQSNRLCYADSSGVAAHEDYEMAINSAVLELVERDALMRNWYEKRPVNHIATEILPEHINKQINYWKSKNRQVYILDMMSIYWPTVQVVIVGMEYPYFVSGAATVGTDKNLHRAVLKALSEAEYSLLMKLRYPQNHCIEPKDVHKPEDHGQLYSMFAYKEKIKWLWSSSIEEKNVYFPHASFELLLQELNPIIIDLSEEKSDIKVVRALCEKCIPISFGYGMNYYMHPQTQYITKKKEQCLFPHYFA